MESPGVDSVFLVVPLLLLLLLLPPLFFIVAEGLIRYWLVCLVRLLAPFFLYSTFRHDSWSRHPFVDCICIWHWHWHIRTERGEFISWFEWVLAGEIICYTFSFSSSCDYKSLIRSLFFLLLLQIPWKCIPGEVTDKRKRNRERETNRHWTAAESRAELRPRRRFY